jgi:hypothetical protein
MAILPGVLFSYVANLIMFCDLIPILFHFILKDKKKHIIILILFNPIYFPGILSLRSKGSSET